MDIPPCAPGAAIVYELRGATPPSVAAPVKGQIVHLVTLPSGAPGAVIVESAPRGWTGVVAVKDLKGCKP